LLATLPLFVGRPETFRQTQQSTYRSSIAQCVLCSEGCNDISIAARNDREPRRISTMKLKGLYLLTLAVLLSLVVSAYAADNDKLVPYRLLTTITIPDGLVGFDISWVD
jgi:hypothetical protein